jgi:hypothetical protein
MRTRTPVVVLLAAAIGTVACRRGLARMASTFAGGLALAGYGPFPKRDPIGQQDLLKLRREEAERNATAHRRVLVRLLERIKAEYAGSPPIGRHRWRHRVGRSARWS